MRVLDLVAYFGRLKGLTRADAYAQGRRLLDEFEQYGGVYVRVLRFITYCCVDQTGRHHVHPDAPSLPLTSNAAWRISPPSAAFGVVARDPTA